MREGRLRAINPEAGFFGVAPGTSAKTNPNAMATLARNSIFTNVALTPDGGVWWEGMTDEPPAECLDWQGKRVDARRSRKETGRKAAHPNARFTAPASQCPTIDPDWEDPGGRADQRHHFRRTARRRRCRWSIRRSTGARGVYIGRDHGFGDDGRRGRGGGQGAPRSDGDAALLRLSHGRLFPALDQDAARRSSETPRIFHVNWFRKDADGKFPLAGIQREYARAELDRGPRPRPGQGRETPIGWMPRYEDIDWTGLEFPREKFDELQAVDRAAWRKEVMAHEELFINLHDHLPPEMIYERELLICRL